MNEEMKVRNKHPTVRRGMHPWNQRHISIVKGICREEGEVINLAAKALI